VDTYGVEEVIRRGTRQIIMNSMWDMHDRGVLDYRKAGWEPSYRMREADYRRLLAGQQKRLAAAKKRAAKSGRPTDN
jgi:hypothetical protein